MYGMGAFGPARQLGIPRGEAQDHIALYFSPYPGVRDFMERTRQQAREQGYVETVFGRRLYLPYIASQPGPTRRRRARCDQRADAGHRRRHHQARAMAAIDGYWLGTGARVDDFAGAR